MKSEIGYKLTYEDIPLHINDYFGPSKSAIRFETILYGIGHGLTLCAIWVSLVARFELKQAAYHSGLALLSIYNRL